MKVLLPYTVLYPEVRAAVAAEEPDTWIEEDLSGGPKSGYWRFVRSQWGSPFIIVEHDIVVFPGALRELWACPRAWCAYLYPMDADVDLAAFGCVKFASPLTDKPWPVPKPVPWFSLDSTMEYALESAGWEKHVHLRHVRHVNPNVLELQRRALERGD